MRQQTLKQETHCVGIGLHSGAKVSLSLKPAPTDSGIVFRRMDRDGFSIPARAEFLSHINHATCLKRDDISIETVEHLLAAFNALGVDNVIVEIDAAEVPIMDGSAAPFIYLIHEAGLKQQGALRSYIRLHEPVSVSEKGRQVTAYPSDVLRLSYGIDFDHPLIREQEYSIEISEASFSEDVAPARTFGFLKDVELMRQRGLALGGSLDNAIVLGETGVLNNPLRFANEFVRHKVLDLLGDLVLLGTSLKAHVVAKRAGHELHTRLVQQILRQPESWTVETERVEAKAQASSVSAPALARSSR